MENEYAPFVVNLRMAIRRTNAGDHLFDVLPFGGVTLQLGAYGWSKKWYVINAAFCSPEDIYLMDTGLEIGEQKGPSIFFSGAAPPSILPAALKLILSDNHRAQSWLNHMLRHDPKRGLWLVTGAPNSFYHEPVIGFSRGKIITDPDLLKESMKLRHVTAVN